MVIKRPHLHPVQYAKRERFDRLVRSVICKLHPAIGESTLDAVRIALRVLQPFNGNQDNGPPGQGTSRPEGMSLASAALDTEPGTIGD
jgi:hypothetical protein